jgi:AcrR family transcriptional regulator
MTSSSPRGAARRKAGTAPSRPERNGGKPAGATTARRELVENEIYEHAIRLFAERGFAGTSLQDIADALGITRPALYYYVKSKDELLAKLAADVAGGSAAQITELAARPDLDAVGKLREIARLTVIRQATQPERFRLVIRSEAELPAELSDAYDASRRAVLETITGVIEEGIRAGRFRPVDARVAALAVIGMCNWVAWWFRPRQRRRRRRPAGRHGHRITAAGRPPHPRGRRASRGTQAAPPGPRLPRTHPRHLNTSTHPARPATAPPPHAEGRLPAHPV